MKKKIERYPVKKKSIYENRKAMLRWKLMRQAEKKRASLNRTFTRYKNDWFIKLLSEATKLKYWTTWDLGRIKQLRLMLEEDFDIPMNLYSAFVYFITYSFMHWENRAKDFHNYVGFICNESSAVRFANYAANKSLLWRKKNSRWPDDFHGKWGIKTSLKGQKLGRRDKVVKYDIMSKEVGKKINKFL